MDMIGKADPFLEMYTQPTAVEKTVRETFDSLEHSATLLASSLASGPPLRRVSWCWCPNWVEVAYDMVKVVRCCYASGRLILHTHIDKALRGRVGTAEDDT